MARVAEPLRAMGAQVTLSAAGTLPMRVQGGALHGIEWRSAIASAQVKSAILLAGLIAGVPVTVIEPTPSRDHTERFLQALGGSEPADSGARALRPFTLAVPGDPSSAAFFAAFAAIGEVGGAGSGAGTVVELPNVLASPTRDGFFRVLARMGARVEAAQPTVTEAGDAVTTYRVAGGPLHGITVGDAADITAMIDEIPLLACVAAVAEGETRVTGAGELRVKESDRIATTVANLRAVGAEADELPDGLIVRGDPGRALSGRVVTHGDHRIAMAFAVLGARRGNAIEVDDPDCVGVSYPGFWDDLARVTR
jgi:3-phosphoshikimate 1-carboxyvinyltransferase